MNIWKELPIFLLQNTSSENLREIPRKIILKVLLFFFTKLQVKTLNVSENAFCIYVLIKIYIEKN